jgi:zinc transporter
MSNETPSEFQITQSGFVWGYSLDGAGNTQVVNASNLKVVLQTIPEASNRSFLWLHFNLSQASTERWLSENTALPPEFFEALHIGSRSTRVEVIDDSLIAVVNDVLHGFSFDPSEISTLWLSVTPRLVISARRKPLKSVDRLRHAVHNGAKITSTVELLTHLLRDQADVLMGIVRDAVAKVDKIEDDLLAGRLNHKRENLGALRRVLVRLQRLMAPEPAALFRLLQRPPVWIPEDDLQDIRQSSEEFSAVLIDMASLQERIKLLQEEIAAMISEKSSRSLFTLTIVTVLALPINLVAGLFGMNVGGIPLAADESGFWVIVCVLAAITTTAIWLILRRGSDN